MIHEHVEEQELLLNFSVGFLLIRLVARPLLSGGQPELQSD